MRFVDEARIQVTAGRGGAGCSSFRREKFVPRGGPDGGDGGRGGDVVLETDPSQSTLLDLRYKKIYRAPNGQPGGPSRKTGASGESVVIQVPPGTLVRFEEDGDIVADLTGPEEQFVAARGGQGGRGNARFVSSTRQAPTHAQPGENGESREIFLELKLIADVGIVGLPNAGKSTLIRRLSASKARVADYPFTTLVPNLGVVGYGPDRSFVVADVPGLIEGAADGAGLGHQFLRHTERTRILVHLLAASTPDEVLADYETLEKELSAYSEDLRSKPRLVVLNKTDLLADEGAADAIASALPPDVRPVLRISALTGAGVDELKHALARAVFA